MPFISIEGCEASGKSTQSLILYRNLVAKNFEAIITKEPGGTHFADQIRSMILSNEIVDSLTEFLLLSAARRDHILSIKQHLKNNKWVITDRFSDSSIAYQGYGKGLDTKIIESLTSIVIDGIVPDLTILLDISIEMMNARLAKSQHHNNFYDKKDIEFHIKVKEGFLELAKRFPERIVIINGNEDVDTVTTNIKDIIEKRFSISL